MIGPNFQMRKLRHRERENTAQRENRIWTIQSITNLNYCPLFPSLSLPPLPLILISVMDYQYQSGMCWDPKDFLVLGAMPCVHVSKRFVLSTATCRRICFGCWGLSGRAAPSVESPRYRWAAIQSSPQGMIKSALAQECLGKASWRR